APLKNTCTLVCHTWKAIKMSVTTPVILCSKNIQLRKNPYLVVLLLVTNTIYTPNTAWNKIVKYITKISNTKTNGNDPIKPAAVLKLSSPYTAKWLMIKCCTTQSPIGTTPKSECNLLLKNSRCFTMCYSLLILNDILI